MIRFHRVSKKYGRGVVALDDVSVNIGKAEMVFLTGPSGAGKTTFLRMIYVAETPTEGQVLVAGRNIAKLRESSIPYLRRNIGVVFQEFRLLEDRTVFENVAMALEVLGTPRDLLRKKVMEILVHVGMQTKMDEWPAGLSGGEQQRVAIARALVNEPAIVLADEPTGNLDASMSRQIIELLSQIKLRGATVIVASHDEELVERHAERVLRLDRGKLVNALTEGGRRL
ncbi:MAG: cell division ATP-binding protein FtsE [Candidatus Lernaella stagnicola]|nr:cell division ATP-binding protein FtsE [Candidatus Lernaella stagnicola]